jgi:diguanylate cyclase
LPEPVAVRSKETRLPLRTLVFGHDPNQALRIKRLLYATTAYLVCTLFVNFSIWQGLVPSLDYWHVITAALLLNALFYAAIRGNWSLALRDPSLTIPQMAVATLVNTYLVYHAHDARGAFLMGYVLILLFGIFRLRARQTLLIGTIAVLSYALIIAYETARGITQNLAAELLQLMVLTFIYPWFAQLGAHLNETRSNLRMSNEKLAQTLFELETAMQQIRLQATHDDLTGIFNRRHMINVMIAEGERVKRSGDRFSILILDIDHFKKINDRYGHPTGDRVLVEFALIVQGQLRASDQLGRYGGEEFLVILPETDIDAAQAAAERIRSAVASAAFRDLDVRVTVSIGVACAESGEAHEEVFSRADRALYRAKARGRDRVEL